MAKRSKNSKRKEQNDVSEQLEQAFLAGLGALANAQKAGSKAFDKLVEQGKSFSRQTTDRSEELIDDVQSAIRSMASDAQSRASGLLEQMRETPQVEKIQGVFDARVADALNRLGVASKQDIEALDEKLDRLVRTYEKNKRSTQKKRAVAKKRNAKKAARKAATRKSTRKTPVKGSAKKAARKAAPSATARRAPSKKRSTKKRTTKKRTTKKR